MHRILLLLTAALVFGCMGPDIGTASQATYQDAGIDTDAKEEICQDFWVNFIDCDSVEVITCGLDILYVRLDMANGEEHTTYHSDFSPALPNPFTPTVYDGGTVTGVKVKVGTPGKVWHIEYFPREDFCGCPLGECGDQECGYMEDCSTCPADCGVCPAECGDGQCSSPAGESCETCQLDCGVCPPTNPEPPAEPPSGGPDAGSPDANQGAPEQPGLLHEDSDDYYYAGGACSGSNGSLGLGALLIAVGLLLRRRLALGLVVLILILPTVSHAQPLRENTGINAERLWMSSDENGTFNVESAFLQKRPGVFTMWMGYSNDPLVVYKDNGDPGRLNDQVGSLVGDRLGGEIIGSVLLGSGLQLAGAMPYVVYQRRGVPSVVSAADVSTYGLGDFRAIPKYQLTSDGSDSAIAISVPITMGTGGAHSYKGEEYMTFTPQLNASLSREGISADMNVGYKFRNTERAVNLKVDDTLITRLGVNKHFGPARISASYSMSSDRYAEWMFGGMYDLDMGQIFAFGGAGSNDGFGTPDWRAVVGFRMFSGLDQPKGTYEPPPLSPEPEPYVPEIPPSPEIEPPDIKKNITLEVDFPHVLFKFDQTKITDYYEDRLKKFVGELDNYLADEDRGWFIQCFGNTDSIGSEEYNYNLAFDRASETCTTLLHQLEMVHLAVSRSNGETRPVAPNTTEEGRALNRAVDIEIVSPSGTIYGDTSRYESATPAHVPDEILDGFGELDYE